MMMRAQCQSNPCWRVHCARRTAWFLYLPQHSRLRHPKNISVCVPMCLASCYACAKKVVNSEQTFCYQKETLKSVNERIRPVVRKYEERNAVARHTAPHYD